ncbi:glycosyltransferase family 2 protein [Aliarcobacter cryaerophilus]|uniref:glycosyltransferase family 2 protein n=1 Tax=Aliarcobacter cryaerophilus TaxID=28198 RepID=UPI0021B2D8AF|nr:glycosyltransferase family 2 protein [Aliarcobacter cryaerophilus]MCT7527177.1 glycosyltransferase family 2 protein [Aliarcobacter cryaerophilus]
MRTNISVVIPSYKVSKYILDVIKDIPEFVNHIIIVDDKCPQNSGQIAKTSTDNRVIICYHEKNLGVGGAVVTGYKKALELNSDIVIKIDGDGQMDVNYMQKLIQPILDGKADYTKGNRFTDFKALRAMPKVRLFGNSGLSFLVKAASGYWNLMDPTNGYTAINKHALEELDLDNIAKRYFFESDMLINLNIENAVVVDVEIPAKYGDEESSLSITKTLVGFPPKLFKGLCKRIFLKYFIYDFNMLSLYLVVGLPMLFFGIVFGSIKWIEAIVSNIETSTGTIMLAVLPIILGTQFILQAIQIDMNNIPRKEK